jgi:protein-S-isoprenylcysteine O-methyltransferase Ste14
MSSSTPSLPQRLVVLAYGLVSYAIFFATFLYTVGFLGDFLVPRAIDGVPMHGPGFALLVNAGLLGLFALQHSVMARPGFKAMLTRFIPEAAERSTYVLMSSLALIATFRWWEPMGGIVWQVRSPLGSSLLLAGFAAGWLIVLAATFFINHFDLFGLRQVWTFFLRQNYAPLTFVTPGPYKLVRHPLYVGWILTFWCTPNMTVAHLVFAVLTTVYILVAIQFEERDLVAHHGVEYLEYRQRTPMLLPKLSGKAEPLASRRG